MKKYFLIIFLLIIALTFSYGQDSSGIICSEARPICTGLLMFPATNNGMQPEVGPDYGCLDEDRPNPSWFYFQVENGGDLIFQISGEHESDDIDFMCWGPYPTPDACGTLLDANHSVWSKIGFTYSGMCSYSPEDVEVCTITNAVAGQYYVVMISNFGKDATNITFSQIGGTATTACRNMSAVPAICNSQSGNYSLSGSIVVSNPPLSGILTVSDNFGIHKDYNAPFNMPLTYQLDGLASNGVSHTVTVSFSANPSINLSRSYTAPVACSCANLSITGLPEIACPNYTEGIPLVGQPVGGSFTGSGISGNSFFPSNAGSGTKTITYSFTGCPPITKNVYIPEKAYTIDNVLSSSVTTFSDNWPLDFAYANKDYASVLSSFDAFSAGSKGIWRGEESFTYVKERIQTTVGQTPKVNIAEDGTFNGMPIFDWTNGLMSSCYTEWRKGNSITKYNPYNFEVENKDILGIYSSALYGYDGNLTTAVAANARNNEIAFESFEEYSAGGAVSPGTLTTGNLTVYTEVPATTDFKTFDREYEVVIGDGNKLTLNIPPNTNLVGRSIRVYGGNINGLENSVEKSIFNYKNIYGTYTIQSVSPDPQGNAERSLVVLDNKFTNTYLWKGKVTVPVSFSTYTPQVNIGQEVKISNVTSHSGKLCLAIRGNVVMEQERLNLNPGNYVFSSWVSIPNTLVPTFRSASNAPVKRGIQIQCLNAAGSILSTSDLIEPSGAVIERWQKLEGEISVPSGTARVVVNMFAPYSGASDYTYLDDIRIFPSDGSMKSYVYNKVNYKLSAVLDDNNYATFYYYNQQGNLYLTKKETERGIMTIQEVQGHQRER